MSWEAIVIVALIVLAIWKTPPDPNKHREKGRRIKMTTDPKAGKVIAIDRKTGKRLKD